MSDLVYAIVDIETTGGSSGNRMTEIAICKTDGKEILSYYETLINPEVFIPHSISLLTGITNDMVSTAPSFKEVANQIDEELRDCVFVAHNVSFDYPIVKNHFADLDQNFNRKKLCTVRLSRGIIKGQASYSLGKLCQNLGISNKNRHRAMGDAQATAELFHLLYSKDEHDFISYSLNQLNKEATIPPNLVKEEYDQLPETTGVYYLMGKKMEILYVGKAKNIKQRITTHFNEKTRKKSELLRRIHHISYEETGNELVAFLLESFEIKKHYPYYNRAQKSKHSAYYVSYYMGQDGIFRIDIFNKKYGGTAIDSFTSVTMARDFLYELVQERGICPKYATLERTKEPCFKGGDCDICNAKISSEEYNERVAGLIKNDVKNTMLIMGRGRSSEEQAAVLVQEGEYKGFTYINSELTSNVHQIVEGIVPYPHNSDTQRIIRQFLSGSMAKRYEILELV
ncbi:MAG: GIY-YIG nuclease family protein [Bacteroidia bacterium]